MPGALDTFHRLKRLLSIRRMAWLRLQAVGTRGAGRAKATGGKAGQSKSRQGN